MASEALVGEPPEDIPVPALRQDIQLLKGWPTHTGEPTWLLFDPLQNKYFRINRTNFILLSLWENATVKTVQQFAEARLKRGLEENEVIALIKFLFANSLTEKSADGSYRALYEQAQKLNRSLSARVLHGYLFFKIPLFRPARFLSLTWPLVRFLFTRTAVLFAFALALVGLYLVSRQWSAFKEQFIDLLSFEGAVFYGVSIIFVKICHELGHAYMSHKYGLRVPIIGAAFLVLMPILYTDTSDAWRLSSRRKRLMIDGAGVFAELFLASVATVLWVFLPDGTARSLCFSIAAVSWVLSLLINLNPFMRFDGYYILSDLLGVENLQLRGFALARWKLRELLFAFGVDEPDRVSQKLRNFMILHAWGTWIYRFFLFLGIALLIYSFFIKVVAIFLFVVEILWFILLPVFREFKQWWEMRAMIVRSRRSYVSMACFAGFLVLMFAPLSGSVNVPAVMHTAKELNIFPSNKGELKELLVNEGDFVKAGQKLAVVHSSDLLLNIERTEKKVALLRRRLDRMGADVLELSNRAVLESDLAGELEELDAQLKRRDALVIRAEVEGTIVDINPALHAGRYIGERTQLFRIRGQSNVQFSGLISEKNVGRIEAGAQGVFYPDNLQFPSVPVVLKSLSQTSFKEFKYPSLAATFGGSVAVQEKQTENKLPAIAGSYFGMEAVAADRQEMAFGQTQRGIVKLDAERRSIAQAIASRVASVLRRETGF